MNTVSLSRQSKSGTAAGASDNTSLINSGGNTSVMSYCPTQVQILLLC